MWGSRETRTGRIVYNRKKHKFRASDLVRLAMRVEITGQLDVQLASLALVFLELKIEDFSGLAGNCLNLAEIWPLWHYYLKQLAGTSWATQFSNKNPIEGVTIGVIIEAWNALAAIKVAEKLSKEDVI